MTIGIYTIHTPHNYGAMLQAYATQKFLCQLGYKAELVFVYSKEDEKRDEYKGCSLSLKSLIIYVYARVFYKVRRKIKRFKEFHQSMSLSRRYYSVDEIYNKPPHYDIHIVGSDQVWNLEHGFPEKAFYFLDFLPSNTVKLSYAPSFGTEEVDGVFYPRLKELLSDFKVLSVREDSGIKIIEDAVSCAAQQVMDPTFLLAKKDWDKLAGNKPLIGGKYILCYGFDGSKASMK